MGKVSLLYKIRYSLLKSQRLRAFAYKLFYSIYRRLWVTCKSYYIRKKNEIKVLFVISELSIWKTEELYLAMLSHPRFLPEIVLEPVSDKQGYEERLINYLKEKDYPYILLDSKETIKETIHPDIIFYQRPYGTVLKKNDYYRNFYALFCYVNYAFHSIDDDFCHIVPLNNLAWQNYYENELAKKHVAKFMPNKAINCVVTGLPMTDSYLKSNTNDPWKPQKYKKKRIIWAPHHTISNQEWINYSTFLDYYDFMLEIAKKYADKVQFAFKPHPSLKWKLDMIWGKERADDYYRQWEIMDNTQYEAGNYIDLFKTSDALIHDCGSFTIEYHHTLMPAIYLVKNANHANNMNEFGKMAFNLHYKAFNKGDITNYIEMIIQGKDTMKNERLAFYEKYILPPKNKNACSNIIQSILGQYL